MAPQPERFTVDVPAATDDPTAPFVVVCGWYGARDKHVKKYTDELVKMGCSTIRTIMPGALVYSPLKGAQDGYARDLLLAVRAARVERGMEKAPLYLMFMSNGGCWWEHNLGILITLITLTLCSKQIHNTTRVHIYENCMHPCRQSDCE